MTGQGFALGAAVAMADLEGDLHPVLARLRAAEPVSWLPVLGGWLVTSRELALRVLRDWRAFTVDDPRFTTAQVVGPSMLSLDGAEHDRHRGPFAEALRMAGDAGGLAQIVRARAASLVSGLAPAGHAELRRSLAGPLAVAVAAEVLGLPDADPAQILGWYDQIVRAVSDLAGQPAPAGGQGQPAGGETRAAGAEALGQLSESLSGVISGGSDSSVLAAAARAGSLGTGEIVSNAVVALFGGIDTTEGMICNAVLYLLANPAQRDAVLADRRLVDGAVEESLRMEPAAAMVDRYATADIRLGEAQIRRGDLVTVSLAGAGRDPAVFAGPDRFDVRRANASQHLAFAHGRHFCIGAQLARLETRAVLAELLQLPGIGLDAARPHQPRGVVFRKPAALHVSWDASQAAQADS